MSRCGRLGSHAMPETRRSRRRPRSEKLPFPDLDLKECGLLAFEITVPIKLRREALGHLKKLTSKTTPEHVWSSKTYKRSHELHGVTLVAHLGAAERPTLLEISYRRGRRPRKPAVDFDRVWGLVQFPSESGAMDAFASAEVEMTPDRSAKLPFSLPLQGVVPETVGQMKGVELIRERDGKRLFEAYVDLEADGTFGLALVFRKEVQQVATAANDLLKAATDLLSIFLVGRAQIGP